MEDYTEINNKLWQILEGEMPIAEAMELMGASQEDICQADEVIREDGTGATYTKVFIEIMIAAYNYLRKFGGVDETKVYNLTIHSFTKEPSRNDIGIMGDQLYLYQGDWTKWE